MSDPNITLKVLSSEIINMKQSLDKLYAEYSKRFTDMQQTISALETDLAKFNVLSK